MAEHKTDADKRVDTPTGTEFVGHEWDGIEELNTPLPRWWLWTFYATVIWGLAYTVFYPAWPMLSSATAGTLGWSSRADLAKQMDQAGAERAPLINALATTTPEAMLANGELYQAAASGGAAAFKIHCIQCHGTGAAGSKGYPNLNDDDWLWGGDIGAIHYTLTHGIRNPDHEQTRASAMPAFEGILTPAEIGAATTHVRSLSGNGAGNSRGAELFAANCASCHGPDGRGLRQFGAPNLTDGIWLYGGDAASITQTIRMSRQGVMPRWNDKLSPATIMMLTAYVHSLGGGEATPATPPAAVTGQANGKP